MGKITFALQGTWQYLTMSVDGTAVPQSVLAASTVTVHGDRFRVATPDGSYDGTFTVDDRKTPHTIDIAFREGPVRGVRLGIFELKKDTWKICLALTDRDRPTRFASRAGSGLALETLRRVSEKPVRAQPKTSGTKPKAVGARSKTTAPEVGARYADELAPIQGTWTMVSAERDGQPMPQSYVAEAKRIAQGDETTVLIRGAVFLSAKMSLDPSKTPKTIDYLLTHGAHRGKTQRGIYQLKNDRLTFCFAPPNKERPKDFSADAGSGRTLSVWKRSDA